MTQSGPIPPPSMGQPPAVPRPAEPRRPWLAAGLALAVAVVAAALIVGRSPVVNGAYSGFWHWGYLRNPVSIGWVLLAAAVVTGLAAAAGVIHSRRRRGSVATGLFVLALAAIALRLSTAWLFSQHMSLGFIDYVVRHPVVGSYYWVAQAVQHEDQILERYPSFMSAVPVDGQLVQTPMHAMNKPPGTVLFNLAFIKVFGDVPGDRTAGLVGLACGLLSLASIPLFYALVRALGGTANAAFHASALWALAPGAGIFFPLFDPMLAAPTLAMALCWTQAMKLDRAGWSIGMGAAFAVTLFFTFNVLPIGLFLAAVGVAAAPGSAAARARRFARHAAVVLGVTVALHVAFHIATGFSLIQTLRAALQNQAYLLQHIPRPYPDTVVWDLVDYALGVAWVPVVLAAAWVLRMMRGGRPRTLLDFAVLAGLAQLVVTAITALLPGETARVWNFLIPLILLPAALELDRWPRGWTVVVYAAMALLTALLARSMVFMWAGPL